MSLANVEIPMPVHMGVDEDGEPFAWWDCALTTEQLAAYERRRLSGVAFQFSIEVRNGMTSYRRGAEVKVFQRVLTFDEAMGIVAELRH